MPTRTEFVRRLRIGASEPLSVGNERMMILGLAIIRVAQYVPGLAVVLVVSRPVTSPAGFLWFAVAVVVAAGVFLDGLLHRRFRPAWIVADIACASTLALLVGRSVGPDVAVSWLNWTFAPLMGAASTAAVALNARRATPMVAVCAGAFFAGVAPWRGGGGGVVVNSIGNGVSIVAFALASGVFASALRRNTRRAQGAMETARTLELAQMTESARATERAHQHRLLHDTVLATLTGLATGVLDPDDSRVRDRCAQDASFVRHLILSEGDPAPTNLAWAVGEALRRHAGAIRDIHHQSDVEASDIPPEVVSAFARATTEALNNVEKHAMTSSVWVTVTGDGDRACVTVVDRGVGFDPATVARGVGLDDSVERRMREVGGNASVDSSPGQGTVVELSWPRP